MNYEYNGRTLFITRYPHTSNPSLRAWSAADEHILRHLNNHELGGKEIAIYNDRFGFLSSHLSEHSPRAVIDFKSQQLSLRKNIERNNLSLTGENEYTPLSSFTRKIDVGIIHIPKSLELYRFYLHLISQQINKNGWVVCSFMTRHFSPQMITIAEDYFEDVEQSLAWKKSRVLILRKKKEASEYNPLTSIPFTFSNGITQNIQQYAGVFSSGNIDYATQFLLENVSLKETDKLILDLASGNGVIARSLQLENPEATIHLVDDSFLAVESSKLNLDSKNTHFHWSDSIEDIGSGDFDLVVSNPPFHFAHEVNTEVAVDLFREVAGALKPGGRFLCVANRHLGYRTHLKKFFTQNEIVAQNDKFVVYESRMTASC